MTRWVALASLLTACVPQPDTPPPVESPTPAPEVQGGGLVVGPVVDCTPDGEAFTRLTEEAAARGLDAVALDSPAPVITSRVLLHDLDLDGDLDAVFGAWEAEPQVFANDGEGRFTRVPIGTGPLPPTAFSLAVADLDGDGLPELIATATGWVGIMDNLGGLEFAPPRDGYAVLGFGTTEVGPIALGDVDGDGDLDLATTSPEPESEGSVGDPAEGQHDLLLLDTGGAMFRVGGLWPDLGVLKTASSIPYLVDRERDGDLDLLVAGLRQGPESAPFRYQRNDGGGSGDPVLVEDNAATGLGTSFAATGIDSADLNGDGLPDLCVTDTAAVRCYLSSEGGWTDATQQLGLAPPSQDPTWSGWGVEVLDLDNDGVLDLAVVGDNDSQNGDPGQARDGIWQGQPAGRFDPRPDAGLTGVGFHYGLAAGDVDGDGALDLLTMGETDVELWMNRCTSGGWIGVDLVGPVPNVEGYGAWVEVEAGGRTAARPVHGVRGAGQGPSRVHVGLGDDVVDVIRVVWPDGHVTEARGLPGRVRVLVSHPDAPEALTAQRGDTL